jgi:hypothetical protein
MVVDADDHDSALRIKLIDAIYTVLVALADSRGASRWICGQVGRYRGCRVPYYVDGDGDANVSDGVCW